MTSLPTIVEVSFSATSSPSFTKIIAFEGEEDFFFLLFFFFDLAEKPSPSLSCLGRVTPGVKDTPFLGSARGAKEAEDLLTRSEFVGGERAGKQEKHTAIYQGSGRPKANSPTPACLDRCHHDGELQVVFLGEVPGRVAAKGRRRADPALGRSPLSSTSSPRLKP